MADNIDIIRAKVKFHLRDVSVKDIDINQIILQSIEDISNETSLFKKVIGFTVHKEKGLYNFRDTLVMNEQVEEELSSVYIGEVSDNELINFLKDPTNFPDPEINKTTFIESSGKSEIVKVMDIFDEEGKSVNHKFHYHGIANYFVEDQLWLDENDGKYFAFVAAVKPHITEILPEDISIIMSAVIEGCKYYINDTFASHTDAQVANVFYQRYWQKKQQLLNQYPSQIFAIQGKRTWL